MDSKEIPAILKLYGFPWSSVGIHTLAAEASSVCIPTEDRGNERVARMQRSGIREWRDFELLGGARLHPGYTARLVLSGSHGLPWEPIRRLTRQVRYAFPRRTVGTRN